MKVYNGSRITEVTPETIYLESVSGTTELKLDVPLLLIGQYVVKNKELYVEEGIVFGLKDVDLVVAQVMNQEYSKVYSLKAETFKDIVCSAVTSLELSKILDDADWEILKQLRD